MKSNSDFNLDDMQRLWQKQSHAFEGHTLVSDDEVRRAMQASPKTEVRPLHPSRMWHRVAAVAVVVLVAGVTLWQWPFGTSGSEGAPVASLRVGDDPDSEVTAPVVPSLPQEDGGYGEVAEAVPAVKPLPTMPVRQKPVLMAKADKPVQQPQSYADVPMLEGTEPVAPAQPLDQTLVARAEMPRQTAWPNRNRRVDTIVVNTNRLVHFEAPKRKSLSETLFEPLLASL